MCHVGLIQRELLSLGSLIQSQITSYSNKFDIPSTLLHAISEELTFLLKTKLSTKNKPRTFTESFSLHAPSQEQTFHQNQHGKSIISHHTCKQHRYSPFHKKQNNPTPNIARTPSCFQKLVKQFEPQQNREINQILLLQLESETEVKPDRIGRSLLGLLSMRMPPPNL